MQGKSGMTFVFPKWSFGDLNKNIHFLTNDNV